MCNLVERGKSLTLNLDVCHNIDHLYISGGEPTLNKDFLKILKQISQNYSKDIHLLTNGRIFSELKNCLALKNIGLKNFVVSVPFHSSNEENFDKITKVKNSMLETKKAIKNLSHFFSVEVRIVMHKLNYSELPLLALYINREFPMVDKVLFIATDYSHNALKNKDILFVRLAEIVLYLEDAISKLDKRYEIKVNQFPLCLLSDAFKKYAKDNTIIEGKHVFLESCKLCLNKKDCSGFWHSYLLLDPSPLS